MRYDFNVLERRANELIAAGRPRDAIRIYLFMADGDPSLDAGYLGKRLGECYERIGSVILMRRNIGTGVPSRRTPKFGSTASPRVSD